MCLILSNFNWIWWYDFQLYLFVVKPYFVNIIAYFWINLLLYDPFFLLKMCCIFYLIIWKMPYSLKLWKILNPPEYFFLIFRQMAPVKQASFLNFLPWIIGYYICRCCVFWPLENVSIIGAIWPKIKKKNFLWVKILKFSVKLRL